MNTERDKKIAEALGLCWHEPHYIVEEGDSFDVYKCEHCKVNFKSNDNSLDFSTFDGMGLILQKGPEREWWDKFYWEVLHKQIEHKQRCYDDEGFPIKGWIIETTLEFKFDLLQDPDRLANELYQFLKEGG